jgi:hypothetical protein
MSSVWQSSQSGFAGKMAGAITRKLPCPRRSNFAPVTRIPSDSARRSCDPVYRASRREGSLRFSRKPVSPHRPRRPSSISSWLPDGVFVTHRCVYMQIRRGDRGGLLMRQLGAAPVGARRLVNVSARTQAGGMRKSSSFAFIAN